MAWLAWMVAIFLATAGSMRALDPERLISQYAHTAWQVPEGLIDIGTSITQTTDGYLWLGTPSGLIRFDGVKFEPYLAPGVDLPTRGINYLLGGRDGSLWIGTTSGLIRFNNGKLRSYSKPGDRSGISAIYEDTDGNIWVTRYRVAPGEGPLCEVQGESLHCFGKSDGIPVSFGLGLTKDSNGNFWFGSSVLCRWRPGSTSTYFDDVLKGKNIGNGVVDVAVQSSGSVWASIDGVGPGLGVREFSHGKWGPYLVPGFDSTEVRSHALFVDRDQSLWIGTENRGLYRLHNGVADHYGTADGLSGNNVVLFFEDREGDLWVVTDGGLDMFRDTPVITFSLRQGLSGSTIRSILALKDQSIWIGNEGGLDVVRNGRLTARRPGRDLPGQDVKALFQDHTGAVWLGLDDRLMVYAQGHFHEVRRPDGHQLAGEVLAITEDTDQNIWVLTSPGVLSKIKGMTVREDDAIRNLAHPQVLAADRSSGIWIGSKSGLTLYRDKSLKTIPLSKKDDAPYVLDLFVDAEGAVYASTVQGLFRWDGSRLNLLNHKNGLPCDGVATAIEDTDRALWLYTQCAIVKIGRSESARWRNSPDANLSTTILTGFEGAHPRLTRSLQPVSSKGPDGRLWFFNGINAQEVDPHREYKNPIPPPVLIKNVIADRKAYPPQAPLQLPALTRDIEIDFAALTFAVPQKVNFRYQLEGRDLGLQEAGPRRQVFYTNLRPGKYRFHVIACNNDGVWNSEGAWLQFSIAPAWYQTEAFLVLSVVAGTLLVYGINCFRVRQVSRVMSARFDERLAERTRIARDLHDTLLQTVQGSKLLADDALDHPPDPVRMQLALSKVSTWLARATIDSRAALSSLRTSSSVRNDLAEALQRATEDETGSRSMAVACSVVGEVRELHPIVRDEIYRIGYEAIRNAYIHSRGSEIRVELRYGRDLHLRVADNGIGIDPAIAESGRNEHFGLQGMRERAARIRARLTIIGSAETGTELKLRVPGSLAFAPSDPPRPSLIGRLLRFLWPRNNRK